MYDSYFGFSQSPFENSLDAEFLFLAEGHKEALASLAYFIKTRKAFALLCGDVGTGKSLLLKCFVERLPESVQPVIVANPYVTWTC
jgi:general secretion pathway protein A